MIKDFLFGVIVSCCFALASFLSAGIDKIPVSNGAKWVFYLGAGYAVGHLISAINWKLQKEN